MRKLTRQTTSTSDTIIVFRAKLLFLAISLGFTAVIIRLFYWQVVQGAQLASQAEAQYERSFSNKGQRGAILTTEGYPLVANEQVYRLFAQPAFLTDSPEQIAASIVPLLLEDHPKYLHATESAEKELIKANLTSNILEKLTNSSSKWVNLYQPVSEEVKIKIEALDFFAVGFDAYFRRWYPEASMAATITGFVGKDENGEDIGYFGIEGALDKELRGRQSTTTILTDALGLQLFNTQLQPQTFTLDGRTVTTTIRRDIQYLLSQKLYQALQKYGAKSGEIIVLEPKTGKILGLSTQPSYDPATFTQFDPQLYKNPTLTSMYEPGSTFKVLTVAAGIDAGVITPQTQCPVCSGPRVFGKYTIRTWNDVYNPNVTIEEALAKSDNTAMIYIAELLGAERFEAYLRHFKIGEKIGLDLQEDSTSPFPQKFGPVETATISFGQGISTNTLQMARAIAAIANSGSMMRPYIVEKVENPQTGETVTIEPVLEAQVVSSKTAKTVADMMVRAAHGGEAQWTAPETYTVAGKTGTSQIPSPSGGYEEDKTIASFVGFTPADNPRFLMLVKLVEPTSSPWAAETAAPLWYDIADDLLLLL